MMNSLNNMMMMPNNSYTGTCTASTNNNVGAGNDRSSVSLCAPSKTSKPFKQEDTYQDSLLGMAASLFDHRSLPRNIIFDESVPSARPEDITSQVLAELTDDIFDASSPPTDDIFDFEPVPLPPSSNHKTVIQQASAEPSRFAILEQTLDQVLNSNNDCLQRNTMMENKRPFADLLPPQLRMQQQQQHEQPSFKKPRTSAASAYEVVAAAGSNVDNSLPQAGESEEDAARRFRPYQAEQWSEKFDELLQFKGVHGHCCVPHTFKENPALARWVKRQRYQYKLKNEGKASTMTDERVVALEKVGFVWDSHGAAWMERWNELQQFRITQGHCNVPSNYPSNPQLATWVKCQRRQYKLFWDGKPSNMTLERISQLERLGFGWELRGSKKSGKKSQNQTQKTRQQPMVAPISTMSQGSSTFAV